MVVLGGGSEGAAVEKAVEASDEGVDAAAASLQVL